MLDFDFPQGTIWYSVFKYKPILEVARLMDYDAMGVGNHDFDDGRDGLLPFAQEAGFPLLAANLNVSAFPEIDAWIDSATILDVQGKFIYETNWSKLTLTPNRPVNLHPLFLQIGHPAC